MKTLTWKQLNQSERRFSLARAPQNRSPEVAGAVSEILLDVKRRGDDAIRELTLKLDNVVVENAQVNVKELQQIASALDSSVKSAIDVAYSNIELFHRASKPSDLIVETVPGVTCQARYIGINRVGLYAPGGKTPLPSSVLMMGVPAQIAGCEEVVLCSSPTTDGAIDPAVAYAAVRCGIEKVFLVGGAQAIGSMAYGTETVPACDKLFGPGSVWVTEAKRQIASSDVPVTIDMAAGPSEVMVIADGKANATFVAADLLAQIEHGADSQAVLVTDCETLADDVSAEVERLAATLSRQDLIRQSLQYSRIIIAENLTQAIEIANRYAAEHLIIQTVEPESLMQGVTAAGSIFLGAWTPEVLGDYCSGTNHVLPTCGLARSVNGLSTVDFMKRMTVQQATEGGLKALAKTATILAEWENLTAHALAVTVRGNVRENIRGNAPGEFDAQSPTPKDIS